ncbi:MAG: 30S ribosomal protein S13 [Thermoplasmata archaeon]
MADEEHKDDFKYIVRLMNTDLDGEQPTLYALRSIKGVGTRVAESIVRNSGLSPNKKIGLLSDSEIDKLKETFKEFVNDVPTWMMNRKRDPYSGEDKHIFGTDLDLYKREDLNKLKKISCYRGVRHEQGQKVRGQRTRSNGRTGMTMGVQRKKLQAQQKKKKE